MLIDQGNLGKDCLRGKTILLTGGGGGIGFETARALARLGAFVIVAEIDREKGLEAETKINSELQHNLVCFFHVDISSDSQLDLLYSFVQERYGYLDVIFNNATVTPFGAVDEVGIDSWDKSYAVNLRAPVLLVRKFLPDMKKRGSGTIVFVPSSGAAPYMGAYEVFKTAQVELCNTLAAELEDTGIVTFSIGPGLVKTETARRGIETVAKHMNMTTEAFYAMNADKMLDAEAAGVGFAVSVALAERYRGQEISSIQALIDAGVYSVSQGEQEARDYSAVQREEILALAGRICQAYNEQMDGWLSRNVFERQWVLRDFKKTTGMSADDMKTRLDQLSDGLSRRDFTLLKQSGRYLGLLKTYFEHQYQLLQSYEKNPTRRKENSEIIQVWIQDLGSIAEMI